MKNDRFDISTILPTISEISNFLEYSIYIFYLNSFFNLRKWTLEKIEGAINNGQSRDTGKIEHNKQNIDKQSKKKNRTQKTKKMSSTDPTNKPSVKPESFAWQEKLEMLVKQNTLTSCSTVLNLIVNTAS